ncbi:MAG TPA: hypothetical protein VMF11_08040 [Candidatus Baltobacteraceae bacterium]|nr:hypothetical protein [Candidatus Baltobacteraceae bacterium]
MVRASLLTLLAALSLFAASKPAYAPSATPAPSVLVAAAGENASLQHYTFDVDAHIALLTFPWIRFTLHGVGTYTRGGDYSVHFDNVPWFGRGFETMPMNSLDVSTWPSVYTIAVAGTQGSVTTLSMHDAKDSELTEARAKVDAVEGPLQILWTYNYGGHVKLTITPQQIGGHYLPAAEEAEIVMPRYRAMAWATFSNYRFDRPAALPESGTGKR